MFNLTLEDLQIAVGVIFLAALFMIHVQRGLFNLLTDSKSSARRLFE